MTEDYRAARDSAVLFRMRNRFGLEISGRAPAQMLTGIITGRVPGPLDHSPDHRHGSWSYSAILTPKGRMVTDLRLVRLPVEREAFLMDLPTTGAGPAKEHLARVLPPRFATAEETSKDLLTVAGPEAAHALVGALGLSGEAASRLVGMDEGGVAATADGTLVLGTGDLGIPCFVVWASPARGGAIGSALREAGAIDATADTWNTLRVEAGRPAFGQDMTKETIPIEAGIQDRAIDHSKGCYTGQEVIVRIRDRGHVNRHLRGLLLEHADVPTVAIELYRSDQAEGKSVGWITSAIDSPRFGVPAALGYVRREVAPGATLRVGTPDGHRAKVYALSDEGWVTE